VFKATRALGRDAVVAVNIGENVHIVEGQSRGQREVQKDPSRRRAAVRRILVGWSDNLAEMPSQAPTPLEDIEARQRAARAYEVLDRLPDKYRRVMILFELEQLTSEEIAALLGAKPNTVRVWLFRAREKFLACQRKLEETEERR